jgi:hypothetical protein
MTNDELDFIIDAIRQTVSNAEKWGKDYCYDRQTNEFQHRSFKGENSADFNQWYTLA